jgi:uncharacterized protein DUF6510
MNVDQSRDSAAPLDGNAAAGMLSELFAYDITTAVLTCDDCSATVEIGAARVFGGAMGSIFRCPHCDHAMIRLVRTPAGFWLDLKGARRLFVRLPRE